MYEKLNLKITTHVHGVNEVATDDVKCFHTENRKTARETISDMI